MISIPIFHRPPQADPVDPDLTLVILLFLHFVSLLHRPRYPRSPIFLLPPPLPSRLPLPHPLILTLLINNTPIPIPLSIPFLLRLLLLSPLIHLFLLILLRLMLFFLLDRFFPSVRMDE